MARYRYVSEWVIDAPMARTWDILLLVAEWPQWWPGFRGVERLADGDERGVGMRVRQQWRSALPMTTTIDLEITDVVRHRLLAGRAGGDMEGTCTWTFEEHGDRSVARFAIDVHPASGLLNLPLPLAQAVFAWNVGVLMRRGGDGLARRLGAAVATRRVADGRDGAPSGSLGAGAGA